MKRRWLRALLVVFIVIFSISCAVHMYVYTMGYYVRTKPRVFERQLQRQRTTQVEGVIIITNYRSGSSFFGQLFNQHPDVFYTFEPLVSVDLRNKTKILESLRSTLTCNFQDISSLDMEGDKRKTLGQCIQNNICFRTRSKELCSRQFCALPITCSKCRRIETDELRSTCNSKSISATKIIRLQNLSTLKPLIEDENMDLKILHLIRDPRGIASSRKKLDNFGSMASTCNKIHNNVNLSLIKQPAWLKGRYKLLRYEDVASSPLKMAKDVYDFVGLEMIDAIRSWIKINTQGKIFMSRDARLKKLNLLRRRKLKSIRYEQFHELVMSDPYTTVRNSNDTWKAWRENLDYPTIEKIQSDCQDVMKLLGYNLLNPNNYISDDYEILQPLGYFNGTTILNSIT